MSNTHPHIAWENALVGSRLTGALNLLRAHLIGVRPARHEDIIRYSSRRERFKRWLVETAPGSRLNFWTGKLLAPPPTVDSFAEADFPGYVPQPVIFTFAGDDEGRTVLVNTEPLHFIFEPGDRPYIEPAEGFVGQFHSIVVTFHGPTGHIFLGTFPLGGSFSLVRPGDTFTAEAGALVIPLDAALATAPEPEPLHREEHMVTDEDADEDAGEPHGPWDWDEFYARYCREEDAA